MSHTGTVKVYELPGERIASLEDFWTVFGEAINGPGGYFGSNLDAFADCLSGGFGTPDEGYVIRWLNSEQARMALGYAETVRQLEKRLAACHPANRASVARQLRAAQQGRGPTVFDWLVEIIRREPTAGWSSAEVPGLQVSRIGPQRRLQRSPLKLSLGACRVGFADHSRRKWEGGGPSPPYGC